MGGTAGVQISSLKLQDWTQSSDELPPLFATTQIRSSETFSNTPESDKKNKSLKGFRMIVLNGVRDLAASYDTFLLDMWGVMHDGTAPYEGVIDAVRSLKREGKELIIISNSSSPKQKSLQTLQRLGFNPDDFQEVVTSGEATYHLLSHIKPIASPLAPKPWSVLEPILDDSERQRNVFCFGTGDGDQEYLESCGWNLSSVEKADLIIARGMVTINGGLKPLVDRTQDSDETYYKIYHEQLAIAAKRRLPMIVSNPDKVRPNVEKTPMPGTIARDYSNKLESGEGDKLIKYIGKPFADVYEIGLRGKDKSRVCMVGDALETDITGATAAGIDAVWVVNDGIHNADVARLGGGSFEKGCTAALENFNRLPADTTYAGGKQVSPKQVLPHFRW